MLSILRTLLLMRIVVITVLLAVFCAGSSLSFAATQGRTHRKAASASQAKSSARARQTAADDDAAASHTASRKSKAKHAAADPDTPVSTSRKVRHASAQDDTPAPARVSRKSRKAAASDDDTPAPASHKLRRASAQQDDAAPARTTRTSRHASTAAQQDDDTPARTARKTRRASTQDDDAAPVRTSRTSRRAAVQDDGDAPARSSRKMRRASSSSQQDDDAPPARRSSRSRRGRASLRNVDLDRTRPRRRALIADPAPAPTRSRSDSDADATAAVPKPRTTPESLALPAPTNSIPMHAPIVAMAPLRGSTESLVRQNEKTDADNLERIEDDTDLDHRIAQGVLVPVPASASLTVNPGLPQNRRYCRPWTASFLADLARAHQAQFHHAFFVSSAVRTVEYQKRLILTNGNAAAAEGDVASPHLTGATIDIAKNGMSRQELYWMRNRLDALQEEGKIDVEEEFKQACFHITVYRSYIGAGPLHKPHHTIAPSDAAGTQNAPVGPPTEGE